MSQPTTLRAVLAQMSVISDTAAARTDSVRVHGGTPDRQPRGPIRTLAEEHAHSSYEKALQALEDARRQRPPRPGKDPDPEPGSFYWRCQIADDDRPAGVLAAVHSVSRATVYRYRLKYRGLRSDRRAA